MDSDNLWYAFFILLWYIVIGIGLRTNKIQGWLTKKGRTLSPRDVALLDFISSVLIAIGVLAGIPIVYLLVTR